VALESLGPDNLASAGYFESLGGGAIGPDLGHYGYPPLTQIFWRTKKHPGRAKHGLKPNQREKAMLTGRAKDLAPTRQSTKVTVYLGLNQESTNYGRF
jgi:hypothetical protein